MAHARLRIVHVVRAPIGGIFRHIVDLATAQAEAGHEVGIVCDALTGGAFEDNAIATVAPRLALGATRVPMRRQVSLSDMRAMRDLLRHLGALAPDVVHGHGAKGGVYGRLIGTWLGRKRPIARVYSPHGGSLHYRETSLEGRVYFAVERHFERLTDALVHVSAYEAETYRRKVGVPRCNAVIIRNGLRADEYVPIVPATDARDVLFLGMIREPQGHRCVPRSAGAAPIAARPRRHGARHRADRTILRPIAPSRARSASRTASPSTRPGRRARRSR